MAAKTPTLRQLHNLDELQKLQDAFACTFHVSAAIVDRDCDPITAPSLWCIACIRADGGFPPDCRARLVGLLAECAATGGAASSLCPHSGLTTAAVPIILDGKMLGAWILDQVRIIDYPEGTPGTLAELIHNMPLAPPATPRLDFEHLFALLQSINSAIMRIGTRERDVAARDRQIRGINDWMDATNAMLRLFIDSSDAPMYVCDYHTGEFLMMNKVFCRVAGRKMEELLGTKCPEAGGTSLSSACTHCQRDQLLDDGGRPNAGYTRVCFHPRFEQWFRCTTRAIRWPEGRLAQMVTMVNVTNECRMQEELRRLAFTDRQTGMPNVQRMLHDLGAFVRAAGADDASRGGLDLVCFDPALGLVRDAFGRDTAEGVLKTILEWVAHEDFGSATLYRLDGDEYCLVIRDATEEEARHAADRIVARFGKPWITGMNGRRAPCFCNVAVSIVHAAMRQLMDPDLVGLIERSLDVARKERRIFVYDEKTDSVMREKRRVEADLVACVNNGMAGFEIHYQPIVHLESGTWKGYEALCRWNSPGHGPVSPAVFIPDAERLGLIGTLGLWVLDQGVKRMKELGLDRHDGFFLSVNISPLQIMDAGFADRVDDILRRHGYPGRQLNLEVTESAEMAFNSFTRSVVERLERLGVRMALDDFGTGYSSFNNLKNLPVSFLKTETDFVRGIENDGYMQYFFYIMSEIAHASNKRLIAEGVETREQFDIIQKNGADFIQGYFFSKPLPSEALPDNMRHFETSSDAFADGAAAPVDLARWLDGSVAYTLTPTILKLLNQCIQALLSDADAGRTFNKALGIVGKHFGLERAFAFVRHNGFFNPASEWRAGGLPSPGGGLTALQTAWVTDGLLERFRSDGMAVSSEAEDSQQDLFRALRHGEDHAVAIMPMWDRGDLIGFVGFDHNRRHSWPPDTLILLHNLALIMASSVRRGRLGGRPGNKSAIITEILNHSDFLATHPDRIPFINKALCNQHILAASF